MTQGPQQSIGEDGSRAPSRYFRSYRYESFSFPEENNERSFFAQTAPPLGSPAPDFELPTLEGATVRLTSLPPAPIVVEFGSYTCPIFTGRIAKMDELANSFPEASFLVVYAREAHPGSVTPQPSTLQAKRANALRMRATDGVGRTVLVDDIDGSTHLRYGGGYNSVFILDERRRVVLRRYWNEPSEVNRVLRDLRCGVRPVPISSLDFGSPSERDRPGVEILRRGGRTALEDFAYAAPRSISSSLMASTDEVRRVVHDALRAAPL